MKKTASAPKIIFTNRLILIPFTVEICREILNNSFETIDSLGLKKGKNWPDEDLIEVIPRIILILSKVPSPTGFESWMIIKKETNEIIGDIGFKGFDEISPKVDLGYGIIETERRKGFAEEAARGLINWAFSSDLLNEITASCFIQNTNSSHLLSKLNFQETSRNNEMIFWSLARPIDS